jgi:hypothetical protein
MSEISIDNFIKREKEIASLKEQLKNSVWKPKIECRIPRKDKQPKRRLMINLEVNDFNKMLKGKSKKNMVRNND